jgi:hypothetical protein
MIALLRFSLACALALNSTMLAMVKLVFECIKWVISTINNDPTKKMHGT